MQGTKKYQLLSSFDRFFIAAILLTQWFMMIYVHFVTLQLDSPAFIVHNLLMFISDVGLSETRDAHSSSSFSLSK